VTSIMSLDSLHGVFILSNNFSKQHTSEHIPMSLIPQSRWISGQWRVYLKTGHLKVILPKLSEF
jgi:hypothetical protein